MEALTGVNVALLTIYDMCKAIHGADGHSSGRKKRRKKRVISKPERIV